MKNFNLVIFILSIIISISVINTKTLSKNKKHKRSSTSFKTKSKQDITSYDNCVVEYNASLFCKFEYPNDPSPTTRECIKDTIKTLKKNEFCVACIRKFFTKLLNKVNIFTSLSQEDSNPEINQVRRDARKHIFDLLLFTTKNCEFVPKNLEEAYHEFLKVVESPNCKSKSDNFVSKLEKIFANTYSGPELQELNACPKVKSVADSVFALLTTPCGQNSSLELRTEENYEVIPDKRVSNKEKKENGRGKENKKPSKKFRIVTDLSELEETNEPNYPALKKNPKNEQDETETPPIIPATKKVEDN